MEKIGNVIIRTMEDLSRIATNGSAHIRVNRAICEPEEFEALFDHFSRGTLLEHLDLKVDPLETQLKCGCGHEQTVNEDHSGYKKCPSCGRFAEVQDNAYELVEPDPSRAGRRRSIRF